MANGATFPVRVSLADIEKARKSQMWAKLRQQVELTETQLIDALLNGEPVLLKQEGR